MTHNGNPSFAEIESPQCHPPWTSPFGVGHSTAAISKAVRRAGQKRFVEHGRQERFAWEEAVRMGRGNSHDQAKSMKQGPGQRKRPTLRLAPIVSQTHPKPPSEEAHNHNLLRQQGSPLQIDVSSHRRSSLEKGDRPTPLHTKKASSSITLEEAFSFSINSSGRHPPERCNSNRDHETRLLPLPDQFHQDSIRLYSSTTTRRARQRKSNCKYRPEHRSPMHKQIHESRRHRTCTK